MVELQNFRIKEFVDAMGNVVFSIEEQVEIGTYLFGVIRIGSRWEWRPFTHWIFKSSNFRTKEGAERHLSYVLGLEHLKKTPVKYHAAHLRHDIDKLFDLSKKQDEKGNNFYEQN